MMQIFELIMLICFGLSWPISVYKSITSKSTQGKSVIFMIAIILGYISGIVGKLVGEQVSYVLIAYCFNLIVVSIDLALCILNRRRERSAAQRRCA
ncbi:MAG: hypothetical protein IKD37_08245 [Clostridia bacterium]|nr:hypothetical protein [Clostridia bacterium]